MLLDPTKPPGFNFDIKNWKLELPIKSDRGILSISGSKLTKGYTSKYFFTDPNDGAMTFYCPADGATTPNSKFPRVELREMPIDGDWALYVGNHKLSAICEVTTVPSRKGIYIGQIHGNNSKLHPQMIKLLWGIDNTISVQVQSDSSPGIEPIHKFGTYKLGEIISYNINITNISSNSAKITITIINFTDSETSSNTKCVDFIYKNIYWASQSYYFKVGNYVQENNNPNHAGIVKFYELSIVHA